MRNTLSIRCRSSVRFAVAAVALLAAHADAAELKLKPPFSAQLPSGEVDAATYADCPVAPPAVITLDTQSRYAVDDSTKSRIDHERSEAYEAQVKPLRAFQSEVVGWANDAVRKPDRPKKGACALKWLAAWARANALSRLSTNQSHFNRDQALSALALAYLQVSAIKTPDSELDAAVSTWLTGLANRSISHYETEAGEMSRANNHRYFAALGVGAAGVAAQDRRLFEWAMATLRIAACTGDGSGALTLEMRRGPRARDYQLFAMGPLAMLAELAERNGVDAYGQCAGGLHRIADYGLRALDDPTNVEAASGARQVDLPAPAKMGSRLAWLAPYAARFPDTPWRQRLKHIGRPSSTALGGNLSVLFPESRRDAL